MINRLYTTENRRFYRNINVSGVVFSTIIVLLVFIIPQNGNSADEPKKETQSNVGGLVGKMEGGTIENSHVRGGQITCEGENCSCGVLVGNMVDGKIKDSSSQDVSVNCVQEKSEE